MNCIHLFPVYPEIFPVFSYDKTSQHSKWMDNLNVDWSSGWILSYFFGCEGKIHKPKPWINQACKVIHTATLGMLLTSVVFKYEDTVKDWWCSGLHTQFTCWKPLVQILAGGAYRFGVLARFHIWWCLLILNKGEITHLVVDMDLE